MELNQLRFLESAENVKSLVRYRTGRQLSTSCAREICTCIQQGRQFFEVASSAPLEIKPLVQFYGLVGFAKALVLGRKLCSLSTLAASHGLRDITVSGARIADLTAKIEHRGTFVEFNDTVASLNRLCYINPSTHPTSVLIPTVDSASISGLEISIKEVLARRPSLAKLYRYTFAEAPKSEMLGGLNYYEHHNYWATSLVDEQGLESRDALVSIVNNWRDRFPYLSRWSVIEASKAWGASYITIANLERGATDDLNTVALPEVKPCHFVSPLRDAPPLEMPRIPLEQMFSGVGGGGTYAISPYKGHYLSEFSLVYIGLFLLGSLVRYRPNIWSHAISRSSLQNLPSDDQSLSLIQSFLESIQSEIPHLIVQALNPYEDRYS